MFKTIGSGGRKMQQRLMIQMSGGPRFERYPMNENLGIEQQLDTAIRGCGEFERLVSMELLNIPMDSTRRRLAFLFILIARDHFKAIIHLMDDGEFRHSAFALVRPVADASFRAIWLAHFASDDEVAFAASNQDAVYPNPKKVVALMKHKGWSDDGLDDSLKVDWAMLCGYVHTGLKQLNGRLYSGIRFPYGEALMMLMRSATYLSFGACYVATGAKNVQVALRIDAANDKLFQMVGTTAVLENIARPWVN